MVPNDPCSEKRRLHTNAAADLTEPRHTYTKKNEINLRTHGTKKPVGPSKTNTARNQRLPTATCSAQPQKKTNILGCFKVLLRPAYPKTTGLAQYDVAPTAPPSPSPSPWTGEKKLVARNRSKTRARRAITSPETIHKSE